MTEKGNPFRIAAARCFPPSSSWSYGSNLIRGSFDFAEQLFERVSLLARQF